MVGRLVAWMADRSAVSKVLTKVDELDVMMVESKVELKVDKKVC